MLFYVGITLIFFVGMEMANRTLPVWVAPVFNTFIIIFFAAIVLKRDFKQLIRKRHV